MFGLSRPCSWQQHAAAGRRILVAVQMVHLSLDGFLNELHKLFERNKDKGSVWLTMKRSNLQHPGDNPRQPRKASKKKKGKAVAAKPPPPRTSNPDAPLMCLLRATDGKRKISCALAPPDLAKFQRDYAVILRAHTIDALKKRVKPKKSDSSGNLKKLGQSASSAH